MVSKLTINWFYNWQCFWSWDNGTHTINIRVGFQFVKHICINWWWLLFVIIVTTGWHQLIDDHMCLVKSGHSVYENISSLSLSPIFVLCLCECVCSYAGWSKLFSIILQSTWFLEAGFLMPGLVANIPRDIHFLASSLLGLEPLWL